MIDNPVPVRKYVMIVGTLVLLAVMAFTALVNGTGQTMAEANLDSGVELAASSTGGSTRGLCRDFGSKTFACAPSKTPKGSPIVKLWEDGSARYKNGATYDSDTGKFQ